VHINAPFKNGERTFGINLVILESRQWSFRKTGTMETLARQAEIGVGKKFEIVYAKSRNPVHFRPENRPQCRPQCVLKHVNNGNKTAFPRVPLEMTRHDSRFLRESIAVATLSFFRSTASALPSKPSVSWKQWKLARSGV